MFKLYTQFVATFVTREPDWGPLGELVYKRTYAQPLPSGGVEDWWQTCMRVIEGMYRVQQAHCERFKLPWSDEKAQRSAQDAYTRMFDFKWSPPGRGLAKMGTDYVDKYGAACLNNCGFVTTKDITNATFATPFAFLMDMSMLGVGVGFDVLGAGKVNIIRPALARELVVRDSREGQVEFIKTILGSYVGVCDYPALVSYDAIRPAGTPIKGFGGRASGPGPLRQLVSDIDSILQPLEGLPLTVTAIVDLMNAIGRMVVSGGVRRTAEIALGPATDEFVSLKDQDNPRMQTWGWCSNNSVYMHEWQETPNAVVQRTAETGEPGYFWLVNAQSWGRGVDKFTTSNKTDHFAVGTNPCAEQTLEDHELCTLVETYPSRHENEKDYHKTLKYAYLYAKTVTLLPTHNERTNAVMMKNRRIGCSPSGVVDAIERHGYNKFRNWFMDEGYEQIQELDVEYSNWLGVPRSIKTTSVKPSGTISKLCGVSEGCHYPYAEYYWQVIRLSSTSPYLKAVQDAGYTTYNLHPKEPNTHAVYIPVKAPNFARAESDVTLWEKVKLAVELQHWWSDNQVSCTVTFKPHEAPDIKRAIDMYSHELKGISFLPSADHGYEHAPKQAMTKEEYDEAVKGLEDINFDEAINEMQEKFCDGAACEVT